jgi:hypothetical protein
MGASLGGSLGGAFAETGIGGSMLGSLATGINESALVSSGLMNPVTVQGLGSGIGSTIGGVAGMLPSLDELTRRSSPGDVRTVKSDISNIQSIGKGAKSISANAQSPRALADQFANLPSDIKSELIKLILG